APTPDPLPLVVGNLEVRRDFVDVRDVARALVAVLHQGQAGKIYHVGTGRSYSVADGLNWLIRLSGRSVKLCVDPRRHARKGPSDSRADVRRIAAHTGWVPSISFEQSLTDLWQEAENSSSTRRLETATRLPLTA